MTYMAMGRHPLVFWVRVPTGRLYKWLSVLLHPCSILSCNVNLRCCYQSNATRLSLARMQLGCSFGGPDLQQCNVVGGCSSNSGSILQHQLLSRLQLE